MPKGIDLDDTYVAKESVEVSATPFLPKSCIEDECV